MAESDQFHVNEAVSYKDKICLIHSIYQVKMGNHTINTFEIEDVMADGHYRVYKHDIRKITDIMDIDFAEEAAEVGDALADAQTPIESDAATDQPSVTAPPPPTPGRFADMSSAEVDDLISGRTSENTKEQTRWALKIFRGKTT